MEIKVNRPQTLRMTGPIVNQAFQEMREAEKKGEQCCFSRTAPLPGLYEAGGFRQMMGGSLSAVLNMRHQGDLLYETAAEMGCPPWACSYVRTQIGLFGLLSSGRLPEGLSLPLPGLAIVTPGICPAANCVEQLARELNIPFFAIELSYLWREPEIELEAAKAKVVQQLKDLIAFLEELTGHPYDWELLRQYMANLKKVATLRVECLELTSNIPAPASAFDHAACLGVQNLFGHRPEAVDYFQRYKAELEDRVANGVAVVPGEKYRLLWEGYPPYSNLRWVSEWLAQRQAVVVVNRYAYLGFWGRQARQMDPDNPLDSIADLLIKLPHQGTVDEAVNSIAELCQFYRVDGLVGHCQMTCRPYVSQEVEVLNRATRRLGLPSVFFQGDQVDTKLFSEADFQDKLQTLIDTIAARKGQ